MADKSDNNRLDELAQQFAAQGWSNEEIFEELSEPHHATGLQTADYVVLGIPNAHIERCPICAYYAVQARDGNDKFMREATAFFADRK